MTQRKLIMLLLSFSFLLSLFSCKLIKSKALNPSKIPNDKIKVDKKTSKDRISFEARASGAIRLAPVEVMILLTTQDSAQQGATESMEKLRLKTLFDLTQLGVNAEKIRFNDNVTSSQSSGFISRMKARVELSTNKNKILGLLRKYVEENAENLKLLSVKNEDEDEKLTRQKTLILRRKAQEAVESSAKNFFHKANKPLGKEISIEESIDQTSNSFENGSAADKAEFSGTQDLQIVNLIYSVTYEGAVGDYSAESGMIG